MTLQCTYSDVEEFGEFRLYVLRKKLTMHRCDTSMYQSQKVRLRYIPLYRWRAIHLKGIVHCKCKEIGERIYLYFIYLMH